VLGRAELAQMKRTAVLINTARGANVDQQALFEALKHGRLLAAALDVFVQEPPAHGEPLLTLENVIATPHLGASAPEAEADMEAMAAENIYQVFNGQVPETLLNRDVLRHVRA
jgi:glyoxylate reductase